MTGQNEPTTKSITATPPLQRKTIVIKYYNINYRKSYQSIDAVYGCTISTKHILPEYTQKNVGNKNPEKTKFHTRNPRIDGVKYRGIYRY